MSKRSRTFNNSQRSVLANFTGISGSGRIVSSDLTEAARKAYTNYAILLNAYNQGLSVSPEKLKAAENELNNANKALTEAYYASEQISSADTYLGHRMPKVEQTNPIVSLPKVEQQQVYSAGTQLKSAVISDSQLSISDQNLKEKDNLKTDTFSGILKNPLILGGLLLLVVSRILIKK
jgi:hypothetical protein